MGDQVIDASGAPARLFATGLPPVAKLVESSGIKASEAR